MQSTVIEAIDHLVMEIYTLEQKELPQRFLDVIDAMGNFIQEMQEKGYSVDLLEELNLIQDAYQRKDYVELADVLLYEIKPAFQALEISG
jgi:hypothetical protein